MALKLIWLADVLKRAQLPVIEEKDWKTRGHGDMRDVKGVLCHHTAGPAEGDSPSLLVVIKGRPDLAGPLAQLFLSRSGVWHIVAAGKAYHAGKGDPGTQWEKFDGNGHLIGIEAENTGLKSDPWPQVQMDSYARGVAALLKEIHASAQMCIGHKEYAPSRKPDPSFDMSAFRTIVRRHMEGGKVLV